jgi:DNA-directed RNA polymerase II subunit RPB1
MSHELPDIKNVGGIQFSISSPEDIRKHSVVEITKYETYDKDIPVVKGLFDIRMGVTDRDMVCATCNQKNTCCPGHFGHVELAKPVLNYHFIQTILKLMKCVCFKCSKLLIDKESEICKLIKNKPSKIRWSEVYNLCSKVKTCGQETVDGCGSKQPSNYKVDGVVGINLHWKEEDLPEVKELMDVDVIKQIFERITDEDSMFMGFDPAWCRPEWLICSVLPVPPPAVRPSVKQDNSQRMDDDLTHKLSDILKANITLQKKINTNAKNEIIQDWINVLQYHVATLIDNELPGISQATHRSGRPLKAIRQRLKGKEGRIRNNLMGKRVDFSARSVITPDPNLELDELGVPVKIASNLTIPETVNTFNIKRLNKLVENGPMKWPGAKSIIKNNGELKISIQHSNKDNLELSIGDVVNRHLLDGDYVLFNRQPSLHKMSMMGHRVKVMKGNTFRLNVSVTPPYNADFDGDEMNMHVPQSQAAKIELVNIAGVVHQVISPRENKPIITIVQDTLLGIYKLTFSELLHHKKGDKLTYSNNTNLYDTSGDHDSVYVPSAVFTKKQVMNLVCNLSTFKGFTPKPDIMVDDRLPMWTGKQILSFIIPNNINLKQENESYDNEPIEVKNMVEIIEGVIKQGTFDKGLFTKTSKGLIHTIYNDLGSDRAKSFIDDLQKIVSYYLLIEGFSVGISDMIAPQESNDQINEVVETKKKVIEGIMQDIHLDIFENLTGQTNKAYFESKVNSVLNETLKDTGKIGLSTLEEKNRVTAMINSGSKGKPTNIAQIVACLGQQNVDGGRIPYGFTDRTLPHYHKYDDSSEARGFVENSFISGQTPQEYFFHAMGGREGLIDTAVKTSQTGYIQRKLVKAMEDLKVHYDSSVRSSSGDIIQFVYADDGMDAIYIESQPLFLTKLSIDEIKKKFMLNPEEKWSTYLTKEAHKFKIKQKKTFKQLFEVNIKQLLEHREFLINHVFNGEPQNNLNYAVHIQRITKNICGESRLNHGNLSDISPIDIIKGNDILKKKLMLPNNFNNSYLFHILIDIHLSPNLLIKEYSITKEKYQKILMLIEQQFYKSRIIPGEMVGPIAAQSIGEPATQMTLNTFHYAGVSAKSNVTRGIPRLRELLHISKVIKSPSVMVFLNKDIENDKNKAQHIKNKLEYTLLKDLVVKCKIYYDPVSSTRESVIEEDRGLLDVYRVFNETFEEEIDNPWLIRFIFDKELMMDKGIVMEDINMALLGWANKGGDIDKVEYIYSDDNSNELIGRLTVNNIISDNSGIEEQSDVISTLKKVSDELLNKLEIKGIKHIYNIVMNNVKYIAYENGEIVNKKRWILETDGTNLLDILNQPYIDFTKTLSNNIIEVYTLLGIEAARSLLINQIVEVITEGAGYINTRHVDLLCDTMTCKGFLTAINKQGITKGDIGPLAKCSFEDTTGQLIKAGIFGEKDNLTGVSSNIMLGQTIPSGTGFTDILLDEEELMNNLQSLQNIEEDQVEATEYDVDHLLTIEEEEKDACTTDEFKFSFE